MRILLLLAMLISSLPTITAQTWYAVLQVGGQALPINIELKEAGGSMQSPLQAEARIPFSDYSSSTDSLHFEVGALQLSYHGRRYPDRIEGQFRQGPFTAPLTFYPEPPEGYAVPADRLRPQEPTDFPYLREEVSFAGGAAGVKISGEVTLPQNGLPKALLLLVSGSGPQDRDSHLGPPIDHRPFLVLSDYLTRQGYGVLRYDERGVGKSTGDFISATSFDFADDAAAAVRYLREREDLAGLSIGIAGHSEGGLIAPMVAAGGLLDFVVLLAAPGIPGDSLLLDQRRAILGQVPADEPVFRAAYAYTTVHTEQADTAFAAGLNDTLLAVIASLPDTARQGIGTAAAPYTSGLVESLRSPWMRRFTATDPATYLAQVSVPVVAINGELDQQVTISNLTAVGAALERAGNTDVTLIPAPGVNHLLQPATTGAPGEYGQIETTIAPAVLEEIEKWLDDRFAG